MTAEELAQMGYPAAMAPAVAQQPSPEELAAMGSGNSAGYNMATMLAGPDPTLQQFSPQSAAGPQMDPQTLAMMGASDPNGFTSDPSAPPPLPLPGNPGEAMPAPTEATAGNMGMTGNPATNAYTPDGAANQGIAPAEQTQTQQPQPQYTEFDKFMIETGRANVDLTPSERLQAHKAYDAIMLKRMEQQDPDKILNRQKLQGEIAAQSTSAINASQEQLDKISTKQSALDSVDDSIGKIDALINSPGRAWISGGTSILPNAPGSKGSDAQAYYLQVKNQAFLAGRDKLRGTGSLSDLESKAAGEAATRLNTRQSEPEFLKTLEEMKGLLLTGRERLAKQVAEMPKPKSLTTEGSSAPQSVTSPATRSSVNRPATLNLKGVMYQLAPDGSYRKATGAR